MGAFLRPLTAPSRYPEYDIFYRLLNNALNLDSPETWLLDIGSPKPFSMLLVSQTKSTVVATDLWEPAIDEAKAISGGLKPKVRAKLRLITADAREPLPQDALPKNELFAGAYSMSVLEHIEPDPGGDRIALRRMAEQVRPGGCVVLSVPVDRRARSEHQQSEIYGRKPEDKKGLFFQRVYDRHALVDLCESVGPLLRLEQCVITEWPEHLLLKVQPKFPVAIGFLGIFFPLLAPLFQVKDSAEIVPEIIRQGDAILRFTRMP